MAEITTVWITEHDDAQVAYVVNELEDMVGNHRDLVEAGIDQGMTLQEYLDSWVRLEMPTVILNGPAPERIAWVEVALSN